MNLITYSSRVSNFVDAADVSGNIKNNRSYLQYLNIIDNACLKASVIAGVVCPIIGGNAISHSFNFLDPLQYQISWFGTIVHNELGVKGDGITGYGLFNDFNTFSIKPKTLGFYSDLATIDSAFRTEIGANGDGSGSNTNTFRMTIKRPDGTFLGGINKHQFGGVSYGTGEGFYLLNKDEFNDVYLHYQNKISSVVNNSNEFSTNNNPFTILTLNGEFSNRQCRFMMSTNSISLEKAKAFSHDIYIAQRSLGRA